MRERVAPPSLRYERAVRAEIQECLAEQRHDDALAWFESLLRDAYPRQLDLFRRYGQLCVQLGRFERGFEILWAAAESIERRAPWYGASAWLHLAELAPTDVRPLRRAALAGRDSPIRPTRFVQPGLRAGYARLVDAGLLGDAAALQADVDFPLAVRSGGEGGTQAVSGEPEPAGHGACSSSSDDVLEDFEERLSEASVLAKYGLVEKSRDVVRRLEQQLPSAAIADEAARTSLARRLAELSHRLVTGEVEQPPVADRRFAAAAEPQTWRAIAQELDEAGEAAAAEYGQARARHVEAQPGCLSGPAVGDRHAVPQARVLLFPDTRVGAVQIRPWASEAAWVPRAAARGQVLVPAGWEALLSFDEDERRVLDVLDRLGPEDVQALQLVDQRLDDDGLAHLRRLTGVRQLSIAGADLACTGALADLSLFIGLRISDMRGQLVGFGPTDEGLRHLAGLAELRDLDISVNGVGDRGLAYLEPLQRLEVLHLDGTGVTDLGLSHLTRLPSLRALDLGRTRVSAEGVLALADIPGLATLALPGIDLTGAPARLFASFPALRDLWVRRTGVPIDALGHCQRLERLDLSGHTLASEDALLALADLPSLHTVFLADMSGHVEPAVEALQRETAGRLTIVRDREAGFLGAPGTSYPITSSPDTTA